MFHHADNALFVIDPRRSKEVGKTFLGEWRPDFWLSDRLGSQMGWPKRGHQLCLAHLIRDVQYAIDAGDAIFAPGMKGLLKRACAIARRRHRLCDSTLKVYEADLERTLDRLLALTLAAPAERKMQRVVRKVRPHLFVFIANREIEPTSNGSERALRPCAVYRKITNGFRGPWAAALYADLRALDAIRLTLAGKLLPVAA